ncbi:hypothetical protein [Haloferax volcanii]|nr:hypothetical protein [Haloferax lucentense]
MSPRNDDPPRNPSERTARSHMVAAFKHLVAALSVLYAVFSAVVTTYPSVERIWAGIVGRHRTTSLIAVLSAPITASVVGLLIWSTYGYRHVEHAVIGDTHSLSQWVAGLWSTTGPTAVALLGLSTLVALATIFSTKNSGLVPTIALVMGPIFGIGLSRYGLPIAHFSPSNLHRLFGTTAMHFETVGAVETLGTALFLALLWGIPIGILGFALGTLARRIGRLFRPNDGQSGVPGA